MQSDEEFLVQLTAIRDGDTNELHALLESWRSLLRVHAHGLLGGRIGARADSSDIVQETMLDALREFPKFRGATKSEWMGWLRSILLARANRARRFHHARKRSVDREVYDIADQAPDVNDDPIDELLEEERRSQIARCLAELPAPMYEVVFRRFFLKEPFEVVAKALDRSPGATRMLWLRAVKRLRTMLATDPSIRDSWLEAEEDPD